MFLNFLNKEITEAQKQKKQKTHSGWRACLFHVDCHPPSLLQHCTHAHGFDR
jgi:hypothetical protein